VTEGQASAMIPTTTARMPRIGVPGALAEVYADHLDWHEVARLVQRGCPPQLALRIAR